jgi:hypothetical protein
LSAFASASSVAGRVAAGDSGGMDGVLIFAGLVLGLVLFDLLVMRFGVDTRFPRDDPHWWQ